MTRDEARERARQTFNAHLDDPSAFFKALDAFVAAQIEAAEADSDRWCESSGWGGLPRPNEAGYAMNWLKRWRETDAKS